MIGRQTAVAHPFRGEAFSWEFSFDQKPGTKYEEPIPESIHHSAERSQRLLRQRIPRLDFQRFLEAANRVAVHFFSEVRTAQVVVRKMARLVAARFRGAFQPGNRFLEAAQLDQIRADVVVRIAKLRINLDGAGCSSSED